VLANLASFLKDVNVFFAELCAGVLSVVLVDKLRQTQSGRHACWAAANDDYIGFHLRAVDVLERSAEN
jgi:hypothetical protein